MPFDSVRKFEKKIAEYSGSKYCVAVDSCSNAIFLTLLYQNIQGRVVYLPKRTYPSVPMAVVHAGGIPCFIDCPWRGTYLLGGTSTVDGAKRFYRGMYQKDYFHCLSFHAKKHLKIGRGGAILTDDKDAYDWFKLARFDGREEMALSDQKSWNVLGWNFYMTPEQASRGLWLLTSMPDYNEDQTEIPDYPDCSKMECFRDV